METISCEEAVRRILLSLHKTDILSADLLWFPDDIKSLTASELIEPANVLAELLRTGQLRSGPRENSDVTK
jgi:hypothetical protein